jgi:hypothetical protein
VPDAIKISLLRITSFHSIWWLNAIINNTLNLKNQIYYLRGVVVFEGGQRTGLRVSSGHYKGFVYRSNYHWKLYDDLKKM